MQENQGDEDGTEKEDDSDNDDQDDPELSAGLRRQSGRYIIYVYIYYK